MRILQGSPLQTFRWQTFKWLKKVIQGFQCRMKAEELGGKPANIAVLTYWHSEMSQDTVLIIQ